MSDLDRRLLEAGSPFERRLLESSDDEQPSPELEQKILAALAVSPAAVDGADSSQVRSVLQQPARARLVRPVAVATIALGLLAGGALMFNKGAAPEPPATTAEPGLPPAPSAPHAPHAEVPAEPPTVTPDSLPTALAPPVVDGTQKAAPIAGRPRGIATTQTSRIDNASSLEREIALLDAVKVKLGAGAASDAAHALDTYDAEFPQGTLRPEATVLRIRTLLLQGKRPEAQRLADDFLAKHPGSVHAKRIRALLAT